MNSDHIRPLHIPHTKVSRRDVIMQALLDQFLEVLRRHNPRSGIYIVKLGGLKFLQLHLTSSLWDRRLGSTLREAWVVHVVGTMIEHEVVD